jgi:hypothetical protein
MADARPALTPDHRELLRHFVGLVDDMSRSRFIERYRKQDHTISFRDKDGQPPLRAPEYDWEDFRSFLTAFRQVAVSSREPVYVFRVVNLLWQYASPKLREQLAQLRKDLAPILEGRYEGIRFGGETPSGSEVSFTSQEILDALVNGQVFHANRERRPTVAFLSGVERWKYLWPLLFEIVIPTLRACIWLFHAIRRDGILDDADYPARSRGPEPARSG